MARDPGCMVFRRFVEFNSKNLLWMQAEITALEGELKELKSADRNPEGEQRFIHSVTAMLNTPGCKHWNKILEARALLKGYNEALLQHRKMLRLMSPHPSDRESLKEKREEANAVHWRYANRDKIETVVHTLFLGLTAGITSGMMIGLGLLKEFWPRMGTAIAFGVLFVALMGVMVHARWGETIAVAIA
ncbi:uncharacterized protein BO97DRAFT_428862 [Aspergillus homomorphus CBS 101889]|uniref:DUF6594 domain-containing protein n=1 Tax=Aspergillus homomorphus (strain CBS 101889) TaxID=1450537 RepID=A0A395HJZ5_ASPHC|nr:hypothetical protein BO97DRAFT_428862 [Aspergillus homomorphus CBS 101889]RAL07936.1 hypothetical protein BO97DRAFT_428862 [Aspergillus homomorphus CBS 101889]